MNCSAPQQRKLPVLGDPIIKSSIVKGENTSDTIYPKIKDFLFINQDSLVVTNKTFNNKIYIADFIFLSCPSICPLMNKNMLSVYRSFETNPDVLFLSHTIDPENDNISRLKNYSENLSVSSNKWHFVTGNKDSIYSIADGYFATAYKDSTAPGGFVHSGGLLLIDKNKHIRGVYDGTNEPEVKRLINDIHILLKE